MFKLIQRTIVIRHLPRTHKNKALLLEDLQKIVSPLKVSFDITTNVFLEPIAALSQNLSKEDSKEVEKKLKEQTVFPKKLQVIDDQKYRSMINQETLAITNFNRKYDSKTILDLCSKFGDVVDFCFPIDLENPPATLKSEQPLNRKLIVSPESLSLSNFGFDFTKLFIESRKWIEEINEYCDQILKGKIDYLQTFIQLHSIWGQLQYFLTFTSQEIHSSEKNLVEKFNQIRSLLNENKEAKKEFYSLLMNLYDYILELRLDQYFYNFEYCFVQFHTKKETQRCFEKMNNEIIGDQKLGVDFKGDKPDWYYDIYKIDECFREIDRQRSISDQFKHDIRLKDSNSQSDSLLWHERKRENEIGYFHDLKESSLLYKLRKRNIDKKPYYLTNDPEYYSKQRKELIQNQAFLYEDQYMIQTLPGRLTKSNVTQKIKSRLIDKFWPIQKSTFQIKNTEPLDILQSQVFEQEKPVRTDKLQDFVRQCFEVPDVDPSAQLLHQLNLRHEQTHGYQFSAEQLDYYSDSETVQRKKENEESNRFNQLLQNQSQDPNYQAQIFSEMLNPPKEIDQKFEFTGNENELEGYLKTLKKQNIQYEVLKEQGKTMIHAKKNLAKYDMEVWKKLILKYKDQWMNMDENASLQDLQFDEEDKEQILKELEKEHNIKDFLDQLEAQLQSEKLKISWDLLYSAETVDRKGLHWSMILDEQLQEQANQVYYEKKIKPYLKKIKDVQQTAQNFQITSQLFQSHQLNYLNYQACKQLIFKSIIYSFKLIYEYRLKHYQQNVNQQQFYKFK